MLIKLRLSLLTGKIADEFKLFVGLTGAVIKSSVRATSAVLSSIIFISDYESIRNTTPEGFKKMGYGDTQIQKNYRLTKDHLE